MNDSATIQRLESRLVRIEKMVKSICQEKREIWVGAADVMKATGWSKDDMYRMRKSQAIVFKKMGKGIVYEINSIPSIFIRHENIPANPPLRM